MINDIHLMVNRFRSFLPVVIDVETGGFNSATDALLEIAAVVIKMEENGYVYPGNPHSFHIKPFDGANIEPAAIEFIGVDPFHPSRIATEEAQALNCIITVIQQEIQKQCCSRAILVGHNAAFDLGFMMALIERCNIKQNPFHPFSCFDTATLSGLAYGQTVLAKACKIAHIDFNKEKAHSACYDTEKTAELFCTIVNRWKDLGGWL